MRTSLDEMLVVGAKADGFPTMHHKQAKSTPEACVIAAKL
jgi:hypothetical protein